MKPKLHLKTSSKKSLASRIRFQLALRLGKTAARLIPILSSLAGRSAQATSFPGRLALKADPHFLAHITASGKVIAVTGSNGKTTTTGAIAHILKQNGHSVLCNREGSNLSSGVAAALLKGTDSRGKISADFIVLEVDERYAASVFRDFAPDFLVVTALFRDQPTRNGDTDTVFRALEKAAAPGTHLILNANDPISSMLAPKNPRTYYALERTALSQTSCIQFTNDAQVCPNCLAPLHYQYHHFNHIGHYRCFSCGHTVPAAAYTASGFQPDTGCFLINRVQLETSCPTLSHIMNLTAAAAVCCEAGLMLRSAIRGAASFVLDSSRFSVSSLENGRTLVRLLSKNQNPVSFDQSIDYLLNQPGAKTVLAFAGNINHTGLCDTTWLYDINFERLSGRIQSFLCLGERACDLAVRLAQIPDRQFTISICQTPELLSSALQNTQGTIYLLAEHGDEPFLKEVFRYDAAC